MENEGGIADLRDAPPELAARLLQPTVRLAGPVDGTMVDRFFAQIMPVLSIEGAIVVELFTPGGDADTGLRLAEEIDALRRLHGRDLWFLGKTLVASAGATIMAGFPAGRRWLSRDATLLLHGRRMTREVRIDGPLKGSRRILQEIIADLDNGLRLEAETFAALAQGSRISAEEVQRRAETGWHVPAAEALATGLVAGLI